MRIGIMSAMHEEIESLLTCIKSPIIIERGGRKYYLGKLWNIETVLVFSRWGKVASSSTATCLIQEFAVDRVLFSGVAGAIDRSLSIGDVVIGDHLYQHDMDARPFYKQFEIPLINRPSFKTDDSMNDDLFAATQVFLHFEETDPDTKKQFHIISPKVIKGDIASGDRFIANRDEALKLKKALPTVLCVEMEGGAVAQVCYEYDVPFSIIRTISDTADHHAANNFLESAREVASKYTHGIVHNYFKLIV